MGTYFVVGQMHGTPEYKTVDLEDAIKHFREIIKNGEDTFASLEFLEDIDNTRSGD